jgi:GDP-mannose 6-dehydrogenase
MDSNQRHLESLLARVEAAGNRNVLLAGLAFKAGTDDLRGSAILELAQSLLLRGFTVQILDPDVAPRNLIGANKRFIECKLPSLESLLVSDVAEPFQKEEPLTLVVSKPCLDLDALSTLLESGDSHHVIDVNGWEELATVAPSYEGLCW